MADEIPELQDEPSALERFFTFLSRPYYVGTSLLGGAAEALGRGDPTALGRGLGDAIEKRPPELSMGQRQLVAVGRAVIGRPSLLLADEPTSSVDEACSRRLMHLFLALHGMGTAVVLATHNQRLVRRHGFPVLELAAGILRPPQPVLSALPMSA